MMFERSLYEKWERLVDVECHIVWYCTKLCSVIHLMLGWADFALFIFVFVCDIAHSVAYKYIYHYLY